MNRKKIACVCNGGNFMNGQVINKASNYHEDEWPELGVSKSIYIKVSYSKVLSCRPEPVTCNYWIRYNTPNICCYNKSITTSNITTCKHWPNPTDGSQQQRQHQHHQKKSQSCSAALVRKDMASNSVRILLFSANDMLISQIVFSLCSPFHILTQETPFSILILMGEPEHKKKIIYGNAKWCYLFAQNEVLKKEYATHFSVSISLYAFVGVWAFFLPLIHCSAYVCFT